MSHRPWRGPALDATHYVRLSHRSAPTLTATNPAAGGAAGAKHMVRSAPNLQVEQVEDSSAGCRMTTKAHAIHVLERHAFGPGPISLDDLRKRPYLRRSGTMRSHEYLLACRASIQQHDRLTQARSPSGLNSTHNLLSLEMPLLAAHHDEGEAAATLDVRPKSAPARPPARQRLLSSPNQLTANLHGIEPRCPYQRKGCVQRGEFELGAVHAVRVGYCMWARASVRCLITRRCNCCTTAVPL